MFLKQLFGYHEIQPFRIPPSLETDFYLCQHLLPAEAYLKVKAHLPFLSDRPIVVTPEKCNRHTVKWKFQTD